MAEDFKVTINARSDRAFDFLTVFGRLTVNVTSPVANLVPLPGHDELVRAFYLDLEMITPEERKRLVGHIANRFNVPPAEVEEGLDIVGMPILDSDCIVTVLHPQRWFD
jgi:hypothetical protein